MAQTKQKIKNSYSKFKTKTRETWNKGKTKVKDTWNKGKAKAKDYSDNIKIVYNDAYRDGWKSCNKTDYPLGTVAVVSVAYGNGFRNKRKYLKLNEKAKKYSN